MGMEHRVPYVNVHRSDGGTGRLIAVRPDGRIARSLAAPATRTNYQRFATQTVGDDGVVYLGVGRAVRTVSAEGRLIWELGVPEGVNASAPVLSPTGDLAVHTDDVQLLVVATGSRGAASAVAIRERRRAQRQRAVRVCPLNVRGIARQGDGGRPLSAGWTRTLATAPMAITVHRKSFSAISRMSTGSPGSRSRERSAHPPT